MQSEIQKRKSELEVLLVDANEGDVDRILLAALKGRVGLEKTNGKIFPRPALYKLPQRERLIVLFLARHALRILGIAGAEPSATPEQLASESQAPVKSCRELLSRLKSDGILQKSSSGYELPAWNIIRAIDELGSGESE